MDRLIAEIGKAIERNPMDASAYGDMLNAYENKIKAGETEWHGENRKLRDRIVDIMGKAGAEKKFGLVAKFGEQYDRSLLIDAPVSFDAYLLYVESKREVKKRFYYPRREKLLKVVNLLQDLADDKYDIVGISLPPGVGKTSTAFFYLTWLAGKYPEEPMLTGSHAVHHCQAVGFHRRYPCSLIGRRKRKWQNVMNTWKKPCARNWKNWIRSTLLMWKCPNRTRNGRGNCTTR